MKAPQPNYVPDYIPEDGFYAMLAANAYRLAQYGG